MPTEISNAAAEAASKTSTMWTAITSGGAGVLFFGFLSKMGLSWLRQRGQLKLQATKAATEERNRIMAEELEDEARAEHEAFEAREAQINAIKADVFHLGKHKEDLGHAELRFATMMELIRVEGEKNRQAMVDLGQSHDRALSNLAVSNQSLIQNLTLRFEQHLNGHDRVA